MPSSIRMVRSVGVPSSSTVSEPRRPGIVPSSNTVTPGAATRSPMRPEKAEVPLRLKSPSRPWPTASCSSTPFQPGPSTTSISPAGQGDGVEVDQGLAQRLVDLSCQLSGRDPGLEAGAAAGAGVAALAPAVALDGDLDVDAAPAGARRGSAGRRRAGSRSSAARRPARPSPARRADRGRGPRRRSPAAGRPCRRSRARRAGSSSP